MTAARGKAAGTVIVGGAIIGSFIAYFLQERGYCGSIRIVERDLTYAKSSTALSAASIRTQFGCPVNVRMSLYGAGFLRDVKSRFGHDADVGLHENGYLILGLPEAAAARRAGLAMQRAQGVDVVALDPEALAARYPCLEVGDLGLSTLGLRNEGWFDAWSLLSLVRRRVIERGGVYVQAEARRLLERGGRIVGVELSTGDVLEADWCVNAAGALSGRLAAEVGIMLPVSPRKRTVFAFKAPLSGAGMPMLFDVSGIWLRPEGDGFITGVAPPEDQDPEAHGDFEPQHELFEDRIWPALAHRIPALQELRLERAWAGHYEVNALDHNGVIGPHDVLQNLLFATGFSGHGVMHAPAVGRGVAEWITTGGFETIDLSDLGYGGIRSGTPLRETIVY